MIRDFILGLPRRSPRWPALRAKHLKAQPTCQACGGTSRLEVHHIESFHTRPDLELDPSNLITLCEAGANCHFTFGHLRDWMVVNPHVEQDVFIYLSRIRQFRKRF